MTYRELSKSVSLKWWPTPQDYNEAVQNPAANIADSELKSAEIFVGPLGIPRPVCGAFASVYRMRKGEKHYAVRCFLRNVEDQHERYTEVSKFIKGDDLPYTVGFDYIKEGILVNGGWFPILKMDWVSGQTLDHYLLANLHNKAALRDIGQKFLRMSEDLRSAGISHCDLQHGNIIVTAERELRLVDYDGMYVPSMKGWTASELGHRNYQHPYRSGKHFGPNLDNFSEWIIYTSIESLALDPALAARMGVGDDSLLFKKEDFQKPLNSAVFKVLESHREGRLRGLSRFVRASVSAHPEAISPLVSDPPEVEVESLSALTNPERGLPVKPGGPLPDWLVGVEGNSPGPRADSNLPAWMIPEDGHFVASVGDLPSVAKTIEPELLLSVPRAVEMQDWDYFLMQFAASTTFVILALFALLVPIQGLSTLFFGVASVMFVIAVFVCLRPINLVMRGFPSLAEIIAIRPVDPTQQQFAVQFRTRTAMELEVTHDKVLGADELKRLGRVGSVFTIVAARNNPDDFLIYKLSPVKARN